MNQNNDIFNFVNLIGGENLQTKDMAVQLVVMNKDFDLFRATTKNDMTNGLIESFLGPISKLLVNGPDRGLQVLDYDPVTKPEHEVIWTLPAEEVPAFQVVQQQLEQPFDELPVYEDESGDLDGVTTLALQIQTPHGDIVIFQRIMPNYILKKSRKLSVIFDGASFGKLDEPAAFQISKNNHAFYFNGKIYVLDQPAFEYIFDYQDKKADIAEEKLTQIETSCLGSILLEEGKTLSALLAGDKTAINKLQKLDENSTLNTATLPKIKLEWDRDIKIDPSTGKMIIETKGDVKELINILNDDYLLSNVTAGRYAVHSKRKIIPKKATT